MGSQSTPTSPREKDDSVTTEEALSHSMSDLSLDTEDRNVTAEDRTPQQKSSSTDEHMDKEDDDDHSESEYGVLL